MNKIDIVGQIADLKKTDYKTSLLLTSLIELLIEKNLFTEQDLSLKAAILDLTSEVAIQNAQSFNRKNIISLQNHHANRNNNHNNI